tara:strand:- start:99 stop:785 length:687 start_codon:yes stop_codon:yes gene_type:complete
MINNNNINISIHIIDSFFFYDNNTINDIYKYIYIRYDKLVKINNIKNCLKQLIRENTIFFNNKTYKLSDKGNVILNQHKHYYYIKIINFYKKYKNNNKNIKKYELREIRQEQQQLRSHLIYNKKQECIICDKKLPLCLLETAHLKPRNILNNNEINDKNVVEFMCRYCHKLYDEGFLTIYNGLLQVSPHINNDNYDLDLKKNKLISYYNLQNEAYFYYHYNYIYKKSI